MKKLAPLFERSARSALWYLLLVVALPVCSLALLGLVYLWQNDQLLWVLLSWLAITAAGYLTFTIRPSHSRGGNTQGTNTETRAEASADDKPSISKQLPNRLDERKDWSTQDHDIWLHSCQNIETVLNRQPAWESLPEHCLQLLSSISGHYHDDRSTHSDGKTATGTDALEYRFTLPEALLVLSVASNRYREVVLTHVPYAERITVSSLVTLYGRQEQLKTGYTWFNRLRRTVRLTNPLAAAIGEIRDQFTSRIFNHLSDNVQTDLKRILLQEVAQVGIDLYSGRLKSSPDEMLSYRSAANRLDADHPPTAVEPLRVLLLGQTSSGKSSLVNALSNTLQAEVDTLPTTDVMQTHILQLDDATRVHLIDTIGLDGTDERMRSTAALAHEADLIIHVTRSTQPARSADQQLFQALKSDFDKRPDRRMPPMLLVVTHVDQLTPKNQWSPPYDLTSDDPKASNMVQALISCRQQIGMPEQLPAVPVCLSAERGYYNIDAVAAQLMMLQDAATLTQWNRRRVERGQQSISWGDRWSQVKGLGQVIGRAALK